MLFALFIFRFAPPQAKNFSLLSVHPSIEGEPMSDELLTQNPSLLASLSDDQQNQLAQSVTGNYHRWKQSRARLEGKWRECWEAYLCDMKSLYTEPEEDTADRSRIARPVLYEAVEGIHANLLNALFPANERFFTVSGKTEANHRHAGIIEEFLRCKLEEANFIEKYALFLKQAVVIGNTVAAAPWRKKSQIRRVDQPVTLFGITVGYHKEVVEETVYNGPEFEVIDMFDFLIDPDAQDFRQAKVIHKVERPLRTLKNNPTYSNVDHLQASHAERLMDADDANKRSKRHAFGLDEQLSENTASPSEQSGIVKLLEAWGDFIIDDRLYENYVCVVANDNTVIRFEPNPYDCGQKPFIFTSFIPVPNEIYGIGAIEKSLGLQHAINTLTNQKLDVINLSINNPFTYLINDDVFDPDTMISRPGALIPVKSHDTLRPIQFLNDFTVAFNEIADLKAEVQEATGALKYFTGGNGVQQRTATEVDALVNGGSQKFSSFLSHLEKTSLEPFLRFVFENARQFISTPENLRIYGKGGSVQFKRILPEIFKGADYSFHIDGSKGVLFKAQELRALVEFLQLVGNTPSMQPLVNVPALFRKIYRRLGFTDEADIFQTPNIDAVLPDALPVLPFNDTEEVDLP
jgi:hypothetical protein